MTIQSSLEAPEPDLSRTSADPANAMVRKEKQAAMRTWQLLAVLAVVLAVLPQLVYPVFLMKIMCFAILTSGVSLLLGYGGLLSFGHAAYFGVGAYTTGYVASRLGWPPEAAILSGIAASLVLGVAFGAVAVRRLGIYFSMVTLALAQLVYFLALQNPQITAGEDGLQPIPRGQLFGSIDLQNMTNLYIFVSVLLILTLLFVYRVMTSPFGRVLQAIRDNEARAQTFGYSARRYKLLMFVLSAGLAGMAGALKAIVMQVVTLADLHLVTTAEPILMMLLGGIGTLFGPLLGASVVVSMQYFLSPFGAWVTVVQGLVFIVCVLSFKQGIVGLLQRLVVRGVR